VLAWNILLAGVSGRAGMYTELNKLADFGFFFQIFEIVFFSSFSFFPFPSFLSQNCKKRQKKSPAFRQGSWAWSLGRSQTLQKAGDSAFDSPFRASAFALQKVDAVGKFPAVVNAYAGALPRKSFYWLRKKRKGFLRLLVQSGKECGIEGLGQSEVSDCLKFRRFNLWAVWCNRFAFLRFRFLLRLWACRN